MGGGERVSCYTGVETGVKGGGRGGRGCREGLYILGYRNDLI